MSNVYTQEDFTGGMNLGIDESLLEANQYVYGINVRTRFGLVEPILSPLLVTGLPDYGLRQGFYAVGRLLIVFIGGQAYYKDFEASSWTLVPNFQMSPTVEYIYGCAVPASTTNFIRMLSSSGSAYDDIILNPTSVTGTPAAFVCQDGVNRPWIIYPVTVAGVTHAEAREIGDYAGWSVYNPEYVPIGRQMMWFNGVLYLVSADGKTIYRSVSGRPLNFVVNIQAVTGAKGGDATTTSFAVDYNEITALIPLNTTSFLVATHYACYSVTLNTTSTLFGEATFDVSFLFYTGVINQFSFVEALGDFLFIDKVGLRSYNAVTQYRFQGKNSVFSSSIASLFTGMVQDSCCCVSFDNYIYFSVKTTMGYCLLVYDTIISKFVSVDIHAASHIKMFAVVYTGNEQILYAMTSQGEIYEMFGDSDYESSMIRTRGWKSSDGFYDVNGSKNPVLFEHQPSKIKLMFSARESGGNVTLFERVDSRISYIAVTKAIPTYTGGIYYPVGPPVICEVPNGYIGIPFISKGLVGFKIAYIIRWTGSSKLASIFIHANVNTSLAPQTNKLSNAL